MNNKILKEMKNDIIKNMLVDVGKIMLTSKEIEVLNNYNIDYKNVLSLKELVLKIEKTLVDEDYPEDLEDISLSIQERDYYQNTNK